MGSGGASGSVSYPQYVENVHDQFLWGGGGNYPDTHVVQSFNDALVSNPFTGLVAYDPDTDVAVAEARIAAFNTAIAGLAAATDFSTMYNTAAGIILEADAYLDTLTLDDTEINADIAAFNDLLTAELEQNTLPQYRAAMLNVGAINSSSYAIGEALLRAAQARDVAKYGTELRVGLSNQYAQLNAQLLIKYREIQANHKVRRGELIRQAVVQLLAYNIKEVELVGTSSQIQNDVTRLKVIAKKEESSEQADYEEKESLWELELYQYVANLLASPGGGVAPTQKRQSKAASALSGALAGASIGATVGGVYGAAAGAVIGAGAGLLTS